MPPLVTALLEALLLSLALSTDAFVASFSYGTGRIRLPLSSALVISAVCSALLAASLFLGGLVRPLLPQETVKILCFLMLFLLGVVKLCDSLLKSLIRRRRIRKRVSFSLFHLSFLLQIYADPQEADVDLSKSLSPGEAFSLALALSLDSLAVGFGAALTDFNPLLAVLSCAAVTFAAVELGCRLGNRLAKNLPWDLSWLSGALLMILAALKL